jgi:hypothetical protein
MSLQKSIAALADTFAQSVVAAIRSASLEEILAEGRGPAPAKRGPGRPPKSALVGGGSNGGHAVKAPKKGGRLPRRSEADLRKVADAIVGALKHAPEGLRSEHLQRVLKLSKKEIIGPLNLALEGKKVTKKGQKRSTTYFAK